jgi:hypothetical protein
MSGKNCRLFSAEKGKMILLGGQKFSPAGARKLNYIIA